MYPLPISGIRDPCRKGRRACSGMGSLLGRQLHSNPAPCLAGGGELLSHSSHPGLGRALLTLVLLHPLRGMGILSDALPGVAPMSTWSYRDRSLVGTPGDIGVGRRPGAPSVRCGHLLGEGRVRVVDWKCVSALAWVGSRSVALPPMLPFPLRQLSASLLRGLRGESLVHRPLGQPPGLFTPQPPGGTPGCRLRCMNSFAPLWPLRPPHGSHWARISPVWMHLRSLSSHLWALHSCFRLGGLACLPGLP